MLIPRSRSTRMPLREMLRHVPYRLLRKENQQTPLSQPPRPGSCRASESLERAVERGQATRRSGKRKAVFKSNMGQTPDVCSRGRISDTHSSVHQRVRQRDRGIVGDLGERHLRKETCRFADKVKWRQRCLAQHAQGHPGLQDKRNNCTHERT